MTLFNVHRLNSGFWKLFLLFKGLHPLQNTMIIMDTRCSGLMEYLPNLFKPVFFVLLLHGNSHTMYAKVFQEPNGLSRP